MVVMTSWLVVGMVGTLWTRTKNSRQRPDNKLKNQRSPLWLRDSGSTREAAFPPWGAVAVSVRSVPFVESVIQQFVATSRAAVEVRICAEYGSRTMALPFDGCHEFNEAPRHPERSSPIAPEETDLTNVWYRET